MDKEKRKEKLYRFKSKLKFFFKIDLWKPLKSFVNMFIFIKYPFLQPQNVWTGKKYWSFREDEYIPTGWRNVFGKQFFKDLRAALIKDGILKTFRFVEIKEKYGTLRLYNNGEGPETEKVIRHYELLSMCYCIDCGKPARYETRGWVEYLCEECFDKYESSNSYRDNYKEYKLACRLKRTDIPKIIRHTSIDDDGAEVPIDIDFAAMWGLEDLEGEE